MVNFFKFLKVSFFKSKIVLFLTVLILIFAPDFYKLLFNLIVSSNVDLNIINTTNFNFTSFTSVKNIESTEFNINAQNEQNKQNKQSIKYLRQHSEYMEYAEYAGYVFGQSKSANSSDSFETNKPHVSQNENGQGSSIFEFIEKISGKRNFEIAVSLSFNVMNKEQMVNFTTSFDMKITNFENFTFFIKEPEILRDITIRYSLITRKIDYIYKKDKFSEHFKVELNQVTSIIQLITDFLSSPLFDVAQSKDGVIFKPKNFQLLSRFGVQPIIAHLKMKNGVPEIIEIKNDKTPEKITLTFEKFRVIG